MPRGEMLVVCCSGLLRCCAMLCCAGAARHATIDSELLVLGVWARSLLSMPVIGALRCLCETLHVLSVRVVTSVVLRSLLESAIFLRFTHLIMPRRITW